MAVMIIANTFMVLTISQDTSKDFIGVNYFSPSNSVRLLFLLTLLYS